MEYFDSYFCCVQSLLPTSSLIEVVDSLIQGEFAQESSYDFKKWCLVSFGILLSNQYEQHGANKNCIVSERCILKIVKMELLRLFVELLDARV